ncbi:MAG: UDP-N-acetylglucosamine 1-carboxyvinyltransferase [Sedimentisphaeraceae bacterium JB056]
MDIFKIHGRTRLSGEITTSGSKNAALPILAATLLTKGTSVIKNVPLLSDTSFMAKILEILGCQCNRDGTTVTINTDNEIKPFGDYDIVRKMRASICILGPLLARCGKVEVSMPGGCAIGDRPIDMHLRGLKALGAEIHLDNGYIVATAPNGLKGTQIFLGGPFGSSVLGTANVAMAATLAEGTTTIECAACEPEIEDLCGLLIAMGAKIKGKGTPRLTIEGVKELHPVDYKVIPDRIEAGTFMIAAAITGGELEITDCDCNHLVAAVDTLSRMGTEIKTTDKGCFVSHKGHILPADITTQPYPGFPTDLQAQFMAMLAMANGNSVVTEKIYPDRFMHIAELNRMGASLRKEGPCTIVNGVEKLTSAPIMASDLRASAALVLAAMAAEGETIINRVYHIDRGYEKIEEKLNAVGAKIIRENI